MKKSLSCWCGLSCWSRWSRWSCTSQSSPATDNRINRTSQSSPATDNRQPTTVKMITIIKYNAGNIKSVENALHRLGADCLVTDDADRIRAADRVIFPGVGEASSAMRYLRERGMDSLLKSLTQPVLGVCLGQQLMCRHSEENDTDCLGIFDCAVKKFPLTDADGKLHREKIPHIGWNDFTEVKGRLFQGISPAEDMYFVHSYYAEICAEATAVCDYILPFSAGLEKDNFYAAQFHPEKSAGAGEKILRNFLEI